MSDSQITQTSFARGIFMDRDAPEDSIYNALNALIDDSGHLYRRGGVSYKDIGGAGSDTRTGIDSVHIATGDHTLVWDADTYYLLNGIDSLEEINTYQPTYIPAAGQRGAVSGGIVFHIADGAGFLVGWAGSRKNSQYATGTIAATEGSVTVTGTGTSWSANVDAGMILQYSGNQIGVVKSVDSDTSITLYAPWAGATITGAAYQLNPKVQLTAATLGSVSDITSITTVADRLLVGIGPRVYFSEANQPLKFEPGNTGVATNYHEMSDGAQVKGLAQQGTTAAVFTSRGVSAIANLPYDAVDASGNVQHEVAQVNSDLILADARGIAAWAGGLIVPCLDDVYLFNLGSAPEPISAGIRPLWRDGVDIRAATVYRGHYVLPLVSETLICRLDQGKAGWTRHSGQMVSPAFTVAAGEILGTSGARVTDCSACWEPTAAVKNDADGSTHSMLFSTRQAPLGGRPQHIERLRVEYVLTDAASDNPTLTAVRYVPETGGGDTITLIRGGGETTGGLSVWQVNQKAERGTFIIQTSGPSAECRIRRIEILYRKSGRA